MLGVWSFVYALAHLVIYLTLDQLCYSVETCQFPTIWEDLTKRPFIFVGMTAFSILAMLALTSTTGWMRRLGRNWQRLHRLVYVAAVARGRALRLGTEGGHQRASLVGLVPGGHPRRARRLRRPEATGAARSGRKSLIYRVLVAKTAGSSPVVSARSPP